MTRSRYQPVYVLILVLISTKSLIATRDSASTGTITLAWNATNVHNEKGFEIDR